MTLRRALAIWLGSLGLGALLVSGGVLLAHVSAHRDLGRLLRNAADQNLLYAVVNATKAEELAALEHLLDTAASAPRGADRLAAETTDTAIATAKARLAGPDSAVTALRLDSLAQALTRRRKVETLLATKVPDTSLSDRLDAWVSALAAETRSIDLLSLDPAPEATSPDIVSRLPEIAAPHLHAVEMLRGIGLRAYGDLLTNRILIEQHLAQAARAQAAQAEATGGTDLGPPPLSAGIADSIHSRTAAVIGTASLARDHARYAPGPDTDPAVQALDLLTDIYQPAESRLLDLLHSGETARATAEATAWRAASRNALNQFVHAEMELSLTLRRMLASEAAASRADLAFYAALTLGAVLMLTLSLLFVERRILAPLAALKARLDAFTEGDYPDSHAEISRFVEFAALESALDRLGTKGRRRQQTQAELARVGDRVANENRQMLADLEAGAEVQRNQLPATPATLPGAVLHALYRPSRIIAGDTFDCITRPDGRSVTFLIDVTGHGAPAALVSVASHIALRQALLSAPVTEPLAAIIARVNRDWAEHLPYFTLIAVETDPVTATAQIVQCGHPALIHLPASGGLHLVGKGGLPIGVLPEAEFATLTASFDPGDRLVLVTDGITDTADPEGTPFGEAAFHALLDKTRTKPVAHLFATLERALWDWAGTEILDDDVTILVLEAR